MRRVPTGFLITALASLLSILPVLVPIGVAQSIEGQSIAGRCGVSARDKDAAADIQTRDQVVLTAGTPLELEILRTLPLKVGEKVTGRLTYPVYAFDRVVIPAGSLLSGVISETPDATKKARVNALLDGDFTPLHESVLTLSLLQSGDGGEMPIVASGRLMDAKIVRLAPRPPKVPLKQRALNAFHEQVRTLTDPLDDPHKGDRVRKYFYRQLPYHPQKIWAGSSFIVELKQPLTMQPVRQTEAPGVAAHPDLTKGTIKARLERSISSQSSKFGDEVTAKLVEPLIDGQNCVQLPEGAELVGMVRQAKPAKFFARNGALRFAFTKAKAPQTRPAEVHGYLSAIEGQRTQNITVDQEGGTKANPDKGRFLAPLVLGVMAFASQDDDGGIARQGITSNGFGLAARVLAMSVASRDASTGFATFATVKSVYRRFVARGHEVSYPRGTYVEVQLSPR